MKYLSLPALCIVTVASALPSQLISRQYGQISGGAATCTSTEHYTVNNAPQTPYETPYRMGSDHFCTSTKSDTCSVGSGTSVAISVAVNFGVSLKLTEILTITSGVSITTTTTTSTSVGETCPKGGFVCGLMYKTTVLDIKGDKYFTYDDNCGAIKGKEQSRTPYSITAPVVRDGKTIVEWAVCISNTNGPKHLDNIPKGISRCPGGA